MTAVVATLPLALIPALNGLGWHSLVRGARPRPAHPARRRADHARGHHRAEHLRCQAGRDHQQHRRAVRDPRHVRVRDDPDGLPQPPGLRRRHQQRRAARRAEYVPDRDVHVAVRDLRLRHRVHPGRGDPRSAPGRAEGRALLDHRRVHHRRRVPARHPDGNPEPARGDQCNGGLGWSPANIIEANFSPHFATIYLLVVSAAIFVCCLSIMAATIRLCFGMSRDNQLPFSAASVEGLAEAAHAVLDLHRGRGLAAIPFIQYSGAGIIAIAATAMIYLSYFLGNLAILRARLRGWPKTRAPFRLGSWGLVVNIIGLLYGGAMLVNFAWPRVAEQPDAESGRTATQLPHRAASTASRSCGQCSCSSSSWAPSTTWSPGGPRSSPR